MKQSKKEMMFDEITRLFSLQEAVEKKWSELTQDIFSLTEEQKVQIKVIRELREAYLMGTFNKE